MFKSIGRQRNETNRKKSARKTETTDSKRHSNATQTETKNRKDTERDR